MRVRRIAALLVLAAAAVAQDAQPPDGRIEGRVLDQQGEPAPNVEVVATGLHAPTEILGRGRTDADGVFVIARVPNDAPCRVHAEVPGHTTALATAWLGPDAPDAAVHLRAWQARTVRGRVLDQDRRPIAGTAVMGSKDHLDMCSAFVPPEVTTDDDGTFELKGVPIGDCVLVAFQNGYAMRQHWLDTADDADVTIVLRRDGGLRLAVQFEALPEHARPTLHLLPRHGNSSFAMLECVRAPRLDADSGLVLDGLLPATWHVIPWCDGIVFEPRSAEVTPDLRDKALTFRAVDAVLVRGVLRDEQGRPLVGRRLAASPSVAHAYRSVQTHAVTDAHGRFELRAPVLPQEAMQLQLCDRSHVLDQRDGAIDPSNPRWNPRSTMRWQTLPVTDRELELVAAPAARLEARLVCDRGRAVPYERATLLVENDVGWAQIWAPVADATSDSGGRVTFPGVRAFDSLVRIEAHGPAGSGTSEPFLLRTGDNATVTVELQRPGRVDGVVRDQRGTALAGVRVACGNNDPETGRPLSGHRSAVLSDRDGRFVFVDVPPGGHQLHVGTRRRADGKARTETFVLPAGGTATIDVTATR